MVKNLPTNAGDTGLIRGSGRFPGGRKWQPALVFLPGEPDGLRLWGHKRVGHDLATKQTKNCPPDSSRLSDNIKQFPVLNS